MSSEMQKVLGALHSPDNATRNAAEVYLNQRLNDSYSETIAALAAELINAQIPESLRQTVGIYLKNILKATDEGLSAHKIEKWNSANPQAKEFVKQSLLQALATPSKEVVRATAQTIGVFGAYDLVHASWPALLPTLAMYANSPETSQFAKCGALDAIGYICEELDDDLPKDKVDLMLTVIFSNAQPDKPNEIRLSAIGAMYNSLDFAGRNFGVAEECNAIVTVIISCASASDVHIRSKAFECLAFIGERFYEILPPFIESIMNISRDIILRDEPEVVTLALEFWSAVGIEERDALDELEDGVKGIVYNRIIENYQQVLFLTSWDCLVKHYNGHVDEYDEDEDIDNVVSSVMNLLDIMSSLLGVNFVHAALPKIHQHINDADLTQKNTAIIVLGCIIQGPNIDASAPIIVQAAPYLVECLKHKSEIIKWSSAWTLGRFLELYSEQWPNNIVWAIFEALLNSLTDTEHVVDGCCLAIGRLCEAVDSDPEAQSNILSRYFGVALDSLFKVCETENIQLKTHAYEAINDLVGRSAVDVRPILMNVITISLQRLNAALVSTEEKSVANICGTICECVRRLPLEALNVNNITHVVMETLFKTIQNASHATVHEEALCTLGHMIDKLGKSYKNYVDHFMPYVFRVLKQTEGTNATIIALGVFGDTCRALGPEILPYIEDIVKCNIEVLGSSTIASEVKPHAIQLFADIVMAISVQFTNYLELTMNILNQAGEFKPAEGDDDDKDLSNAQKAAIMEAYAAIVLEYSQNNGLEIIAKFFPQIVNLLARIGNEQDRIGNDEEKAHEVLSGAVHLLGDLSAFIPNELKGSSLVALIDEAREGDDTDLRNIANQVYATIFAK